MTTKINRPGKLEKVCLAHMIVCDQAQRDLKPYRVKDLLAEFDLDLLAEVTLSYRDGKYFIVDGQHRVAALKEWLGEGWEKQQIECRVFTGLTLVQEAHLFDALNNKLTVRPLDLFRVRLTACEPHETAVNSIVKKQGLHISKNKGDLAIGAVSTLLQVYARAGEHILGKSLRMIRDAYPGAAFSSSLVNGIAYMCERYNGVLDEETATQHLGSLRGGVTALIAKSEILHRQTRQSRPHCIAAAAVDVINAKSGRGKKLPDWWSA